MLSRRLSKLVVAAALVGAFVAALFALGAPASAMPTITLLAPLDNSTVTGSSPFEVRAHVDGVNLTVNISGTSVALDAGGNLSANVSLAEGPNYFTIAAIDDLSETATGSFRVTLDTLNPTGAMYLANRSAYATSFTLGLTLLGFDGGGLQEARLSNDPAFATWTTIAIPKAAGNWQTALFQELSWDLPPGDGVKTVYLRLVDAAGHFSAMYNDSILIDTTPPNITAAVPGSVEHWGAIFVTSSQLVVNVSATDPLDVARVEISGTASFADATQFAAIGNLTYGLPSASGNYSLFVRAEDLYGLVSTVVHIDLYLDLSAPTGMVTIRYTGQTLGDFLAGTPGCCNETGLAKARGVVIDLEATDNVGVAEFEVSSSLYFPGAVWQPFEPGAHYFVLSDNDGTDKTAYVRFRDINGLVSQAFFDQIDLDTTPPLGSIIINDGDANTTDPLLSLSLEATDNFAGDLQMRLALTPDFTASTWLPFMDRARFDAHTASGRVTVYFQVRDANGWESLTYSDAIDVIPPPSSTPAPAPLPPAAQLTVNGGDHPEVAADVPVELSVNLSNTSGLTITWFVDHEQVGSGPKVNLSLPEGTHTVSANVSNGEQNRSYTWEVVAHRVAAVAPPGGPFQASFSVLIAVAAVGAGVGFFLWRRRAAKREEGEPASKK